MEQSVTFEMVAGRPQTVLRRTFRAPQPEVFRAWTDEQLLPRWWGPHLVHVPECRFDAVVGSRYRIVMRSNDGVDYPMYGEVRAVQSPEHYAMTVRLDDHPANWIAVFRPPGTALESVELEWLYEISFLDRDGATEVTVLATYPVFEDRDRMLDVGSEQGWAESFEKLDQLLRDR